MDRRAVRDLDRLSPNEFKRVDERILALGSNPRPRGVVKLHGNVHRIRVGSWRVIYVRYDASNIVIISPVKRREKDTYRTAR